MKVRWSPEAADDLVGIVQYIRNDNAPAAERVARTIYNGVATLSEFPRKGRPGREPNTRELVFSPLPYIVVYRETGDTIEIARILHGAQRWP
jgi:toxin ParE1/3/4